MRDSTLKIAVLFGGASAERDVSISSATQVINALRCAGHSVVAIDTARGPLSPEEDALLLTSRIQDAPPPSIAPAQSPSAVFDLLRFPELTEADVAFLALHGGAGEDGTIQAMLDLAGVPYTGSGHMGSAIAMNKNMAKRLFSSGGIRTPRWLMLPCDFDDIPRRVGYPLIVKPNRQGSTVGLSLVHAPDELENAVHLARQFDTQVMVEQYIAGRELTVGVLGTQALSVGEIVIEPGTIFDYRSKYQAGHVREQFPATLPAATLEAAQRIALRAHALLELDGYSRTDLRLDAQGMLWCLEVNTLPGMTATSLLPQSAAASGIAFSQLCEQICLAGIHRDRALA
ncbi:MULTISPECIES: D-alanine--D-alanine ligase [Burkholderia]|uniref:D-alanine--D-alanine ligase n=1 Tax=Burkholderia aenigmatica TaxID=2015348 RepID=A0ABY6Y6Z3_9BURK|nr:MULTISPECIES: D-alanine--D-alanine ligase [Burkholderia]VWC93161.1 D-alanine--D-alanine ligase [Burkholderia aenigmatica]VWD46902.1 D-alanine--D-alanine ligase [Burkholderia aenigmatica]